MNAKVKGITYALIGGTCWGLSGIVGKLLFDTRGLNAQWLVTARLIIGGLIMLLIAFLQKKEKIFDVWKNKKTACSMLLFAAFGMLACQLTYFLCVQYSNPATATVLQYTSPVMIMILCLFLDKKLPRIIDILVLIAVVAGVFLMSTHGDIHTLAISQKALILGMIAAVTNTDGIHAFVAVETTSPMMYTAAQSTNASAKLYMSFPPLYLFSTYFGGRTASFHGFAFSHPI